MLAAAGVDSVGDVAGDDDGDTADGAAAAAAAAADMITKLAHFPEF